MQDQQADDHFGESKGMANHTHDLVHDLSNRLDAVWRYDQYIVNAQKKGADDVAQHWEAAKKEDERIIERAKELLKKHLGGTQKG